MCHYYLTTIYLDLMYYLPSDNNDEREKENIPQPFWSTCTAKKNYAFSFIYIFIPHI